MIILASASKRRISLLKDAGIDFKVIPSNIDETIDNRLTPTENVLKLSKDKALDVYESNKENIIIAADTIVVYKGEIFGKPVDGEDAFNMLKKLSNKTHEVITAVTIINKEEIDSFYSITKVTFKDLTDEEIRNYIETKEPYGKAGSYAIQGLGKELVLTFDGDFFTIVGLPLKEVLKRLDKITNE